MRDIRRVFKPGGNWHKEPPEVAEFRAAVREKPRAFMRDHLFIRTQEANIEPLVPNWSQIQVLNHLDAMEKSGEPVRAIILKARRVGISTVCSGRVFTKCYANNNTEALIMAHLQDVTEEIFQMQHLFLKMLDPTVALPLKRSNKKELFWEAINSKIILATSGSPQSTRSKTIHHALCSEAAFYKDMKVLRAALEATVPKHSKASLIWESTAFGAGTEFHDLWNEAWSGESHYKAIWLEWFKDPECQFAEGYYPNNMVQDAYLEWLFGKYPDLRERMKHFALTPRQIGWYGAKMHNDYSGDSRIMRQEFPCTPEEAFLATGEPVFNQTHFEKYKNGTKPGTRYDVQGKWTNLEQARIDPHLRHGKESYFEIYCPPQKGHHYLIAADPSRGNNSSDPAAGVILDIVTQNVCGVIHGRMDLKLFSQVLRKLGRIYNDALLMPEITGLGIGLLSYLTEDYFHIYQQRKKDNFRLEVTNKLGWETSTSSRLEMVSTAKTLFNERALNKPDHFIPCKALIDEITTFVQNNLNKPEAADKCTDDLVIAWCIGVQGCMEELRTRPDLLPTISSSKNEAGNRLLVSPEETLTLWRNPNFIPGVPYEPPDDESGPFINMNHLKEDETW